MAARTGSTAGESSISQDAPVGEPSEGSQNHFISREISTIKTTKATGNGLLSFPARFHTLRAMGGR